MSSILSLAASTLRWLSPLCILPLAFGASRFLPYRRMRLMIYFVLFVIAIVFNLLHLSFANDALDVIVSNLYLFMVAEYLWLVSRARTRWRTVTLLLFLLVQISAGRHWIAGGPLHHVSVWQTQRVATFRHHGSTFLIKQRMVPSFAGRQRQFSMRHLLAAGLLEQALDSWTAPECYVQSAYKGKWLNLASGLQHQIFLDNTPLWTLKATAP